MYALLIYQNSQGGVVFWILPGGLFRKEFLAFVVLYEDFVKAKVLAEVFLQSLEKLIGIGDWSDDPIAVLNGTASTGVAFLAIAILQTGIVNNLIGQFGFARGLAHLIFFCSRNSSIVSAVSSCPALEK